MLRSGRASHDAVVPDPDAARDPSNELYDHGFDLVEAATRLRNAASGAGVSRAAPAVLGCVEAALEQLTEAVGELGAVAGEAVEDSTNGDDPRIAASRRRMLDGFVNLDAALRDARGFASAARALTARALERAGVTRPRVVR